MRIALVSDIHGNLPALQAVADDIARRGADQVANLGDIVSGPLWPAETADWLMARNWPTLAGNHERQVLAPDPARHGESDAFAARCLSPRQREWLAAQPAERWLHDEVYACHGRPGDDLRYWLETVTDDFGRHDSLGLRAATPDEIAARGHAGSARARVAVCGHSHVPRVVALPGGALCVNPGSVGLPGYDDLHPHLHWVQNDGPAARYACLTRHQGQWQAELITVPYDHECAARRAEANGRPDWAYSLRTGRVRARELGDNPAP